MYFFYRLGGNSSTSSFPGKTPASVSTIKSRSRVTVVVDGRAWRSISSVPPFSQQKMTYQEDTQTVPYRSKMNPNLKRNFALFPVLDPSACDAQAGRRDVIRKILETRACGKNPFDVAQDRPMPRLACASAQAGGSRSSEQRDYFPLLLQPVDVKTSCPGWSQCPALL
jgi:hypothetical protein